MSLADRVTTFGQYLLHKYGERVHKIALNAGLGGCTFCNNASFSPAQRQSPGLSGQLDAGRRVIRRRTGAYRYLAYFQAYTNTYGDVARLRQLYDQALAETDVIGLAVGTRPDCVPDKVLDLLCHYRDLGHEVWLELGLQSAHDATLRAVNRGHGFAEYHRAVHAARSRQLPVCTHLILGLPGEDKHAMESSFHRVLELGVDGLKLHPLHVVKGTQLARQWNRGDYRPLTMNDYVALAASLIEQTPADIIYHRVTGTAPRDILLAPAWCAKKWQVINAIEEALQQRNSYQGRLLEAPPPLGLQAVH